MIKEFKNIIGYDHIKIELERIIDAMKNIDDYKKLGVRTTRGLLLDGEPGVGKTTMAKAVISAAGRPCFTIRKDASSGDLVKTIKKTFDEAKKCAPSIVFLDDLDKFANEDSYHRNSDEFITVQSCIDDCKDLEVFVIATANELNCLPDSLLRPGRFDKHITVDTPTGKDAELIVKYYLSKQKIAKDISFKDVARFLNGHSCASLETVINEAGIYAAYERKSEVDMGDIIKAFLRVAYNAPDMLSDKETKQLKYTAVHEAGHVVISELFSPGSITVATVKKHASRVEGFVEFITGSIENDYNDESFETLENSIYTCLAGKAAMEVVYGISDTGCAEDINKAHNTIEYLYEKSCATDFLLRGYISHWDECLDSPNKLAVIQSKLSDYYMKTKKMLIEHRDFLDAISKELLTYKTITFKEIEQVEKNILD